MEPASTQQEAGAWLGVQAGWRLERGAVRAESHEAGE